MIRATVSSLIAIVLMTAFFGLAYPVVMTGFAQVAFKGQANGSLIERNGKVVGSELIAQGFSSTKYFHPRPTATAPPYTAGGTWLGGDTTFANLGPTNPTLAKNVQAEAQAILKLEGPYNPGLTIHDIPVDAVTTSGSGVDPEISPANAQLQARRVAAVRHLPLATIQQLISKYTIGRSWDFFGEPGVNVLELNLALDAQQGGS
jgi:K+-transporting ATPase ATPase C chain